MGQVENRRKLTEAMRKAMKPDKAKHNVLAPSRLVWWRSRVSAFAKSPTSRRPNSVSCNGTGKVEASILVTDRIEDALKAAADRGLEGHPVDPPDGGGLCDPWILEQP